MLEKSQTSLSWRGETDQYAVLRTANSFCTRLLANTVETGTTWDYVAGEEMVTYMFCLTEGQGVCDARATLQPCFSNPRQGSGLEFCPPHQGFPAAFTVLGSKDAVQVVFGNIVG